MWSKEPHREVRTRKQASNEFPIQTDLKQDVLSTLLSQFAYKYVIRKVQ